MAKMLNRAKMSVASTGTGTLTLGSAVSGYQTFLSAGVSNGDTLSFAIEDGTSWEISTGTYNSSGPTLTRTVIRSFDGTTYGTSPINVTALAQVFATAFASDLQSGTSAGNLVALDGSAKLPAVDGSSLTNISASNINGTLSVTKGGSGAASLSGILKGNGTSAFTAATAGTDYVAPGGALGTPSSGTLTNCSGLLSSGVIGLATSATTDTTNASNIVTGTLSNSRLSGVLLAANNLSDVTAATARTNLGLGSAATLTAGTSANNLVQLDGTAKLPAVDGSQLTGISAGATGGGTDKAFYLNDLTINSSYTIPSTSNAGTFGPITIGASATVTVSANSTWTIV